MINVTEQISSVRRTLGDRSLEAGDARVLTISQAYDTDVDDLWDVVTRADRIARWFLPISGELHEGGKFQFEGNAGGTITRCEQPHSFAATWEFGGQVSWIEVRLTAEGDGRSRFELEHTAHVDDHWDQFGPGAVGVGWDSGLLGLALHLAAPDAPRDTEAIMAWMASDDGKRFMKESSDAWAAADVAAGTDPVTAEKRAAATFAAYTGAA
ncbi:SRPBCC family protein [Actinoplanes awajinensis]|uniref:Polyketide cyclase n=1 Tax=Actinoplanes awajinensis subsp. mycoplanecinus TaxID=135947 RepID=A0A124G7N5_9ACTN|nr:SRPBCC family protein [Actinoplanes awajinensis]KUL23350.1 polyketide cyclase [Actinoplanes awajinensis subsp. mycoplanecinus]